MASERTIRWAKAAVLFAAALVLIIAISFSGKRAGNLRSTTTRKALQDFRLSDLSGTQWRLSDHRGQVVLLNFWATWCEACRYETPDLVSISRSYSGRGLYVLGIDMDHDAPASVPPFLREYRIPYQVVIADSSFALADNLEALPTSVLLDRSGRVAWTHIGAVSAAELRSVIDPLLNERT